MKIKFSGDRPVMEFCGAVVMYGILSEEGNSDIRQIVNSDELIMNMMKKLELGLSRFVKSEIAFWNKNDILEVSLESIIYDNPDVITVQDYFEKFTSYSDERLFETYAGAIWSENDMDSTLFDKAKGSMEGFRTLVDKCSEFPDDILNDLKEMLSFPVETRNRILFVLRSIYDIYKQDEENIIKCAREIRLKWKKIYAKNPEDVVMDHDLWNISDKFLKKKEIEVYVSRIFSIINHYKVYEDEKVYLNYGYKEKEYNSLDKLDMELFYKAISDSTRRNIIQAFSERPYYPRELALKLDVKASTINHHIQILYELGLISALPEENGLRQYYELDRSVAARYIFSMKQEVFAIE